MILIAELSCNHLGSLAKARELVIAAADSGADAVKFQTFKPEKMCLRPYIIQSGPWAGRDLQDLYREAYTPWEWHKELFELSDSLGMVAFSTPFDLESLAFLESIDCPWYKISSFEIVDLDLIRACAATRKPLFISTGMATVEEVADAYVAASASPEVTFLKCTSAYPSPFEECNLQTIVDLKESFGSVGLSDHTKGIAVPIAAVALGAVIVEKHFSLSRKEGLDADFSLEPHEFKQMAQECRNAEAALGEVKFGPAASEKSSFDLRRSLYFAKDIEAGQTLTKDYVVTARPNLGMKPARLDEVLGHVMAQSAKAGDPIREEMIK
jgi:pseudaminic acid synthase